MHAPNSCKQIAIKDETVHMDYCMGVVRRRLSQAIEKPILSMNFSRCNYQYDVLNDPFQTPAHRFTAPTNVLCYPGKNADKRVSARTK